MNHYTILEDVGLVVCDDCGAFAETPEDVKHYPSCKPGDSEKWEKYYNEQEEE